MTVRTAFLVQAGKCATPHDAALPDALPAECAEPGPDRPVDASHILRYAQSPFSLYCDAFADESFKDAPDPAADATAGRASAHRKKILKEMHPDARPAEARTEREAFGAALRLMAGGAHAVMGCPLFHAPSGMTAVPDVLERKSGASVFGKHHYAVTQIENVVEPAKHHLLRAAFCSLVIGRIQGRVPDEFAIVNAAGDVRQFEFARLSGDLDSAVAGARRALSGEAPPAIFGTDLYPWRRHNDRVARESGDVSLVGGVGADTRSKLHGAGIRTVDDMVHAGQDRLTAIDGIGRRKAASYMASAEALSTGRPVRKGTAPELPARRTEVFLDVQGTDVMGEKNPTDYLLGALVRRDGRGEYSSFVARDGEERMYRDFLGLVGGCRGGTAYHWYAYEAAHLKRMRDRYGCGRDVLAGCPLHDLRRTAVSAYAFPVPGTGLKGISEWMGYGWEGPDAEPAASALLYGEYARDPDANAGVLEHVLGRSRDKCAALAAVRDWLADPCPDGVAP